MPKPEEGDDLQAAASEAPASREQKSESDEGVHPILIGSRAHLFCSRTSVMAASVNKRSIARPRSLAARDSDHAEDADAERPQSRLTAEIILDASIRVRRVCRGCFRCSLYCAFGTHLRCLSDTRRSLPFPSTAPRSCDPLSGPLGGGGSFLLRRAICSASILTLL